jgi:hypothetical protein
MAVTTPFAKPTFIPEVTTPLARPAVVHTWLNCECTLRTRNTINEEGDSWYFVFPRKMRRYAPINQGEGRSHDQVMNGWKSSICYLDTDTQLYAAIKAIRGEGREAHRAHTIAKNVHVANVVGDYIVLGVRNYPEQGHSMAGFCYRKPEIGLATLDFNNNDDGGLTNAHLGHLIIEVVHSFDREAYTKFFGDA